MRLLTLAMLPVLALPLRAQWREPAVLRRATPASAVAVSSGASLAARARESGGSLPLEMLGGTIGSLAGMAIVGLDADCGVDDLGCLVQTIARGGALGAAGATLGVVLTARATKGPRSVGGAALGAVAGTGVGLGVHWLLNRNSDRNLDDAPVVIPIFAVAQGVGAALGSRWLAR